VSRVCEREEERDGDRLHPGRAKALGRRLDARRIERNDDLALRVDALPRLEAQLARNEGLRLRKGEVVEAGTHLRPDLEHVAEPFGRQEPDARDGALHESVRGDRRPVDEERDARCDETGPIEKSVQRLDESFRQVGGCRPDLGDSEFGAVVERGIRKRAPDVDTRSRSGHGWPRS
jgi:hypothetical protein